MRYIDAEKIKVTADTMIADGECYVPLLSVKQAIARTPVCVKTEKIDGYRIKEDTFYMLKNGEFVEVQ